MLDRLLSDGRNENIVELQALKRQYCFLFGSLIRIACYNFLCFLCLLLHGYWPRSTYISALHHGELFPAALLPFSIRSISFSGCKNTKQKVEHGNKG